MIHKILCASTANITPTTASKLDAAVEDEKIYDGFTVYPKAGYGYYLVLCELDTLLDELLTCHIPSDLKALIEYALNKGCNRIDLDRDADIDCDLPDYTFLWMWSC